MAPNSLTPALAGHQQRPCLGASSTMPKQWPSPLPKTIEECSCLLTLGMAARGAADLAAGRKHG